MTTDGRKNNGGVKGVRHGPNHGGKRRRTMPPALTPAQVQEVREARSRRVPYKVLVAKYGVCRETLSRAVNGVGDYATLPALIDCRTCHNFRGSYCYNATPWRTQCIDGDQYSPMMVLQLWKKKDDNTP